MGLPLRQNFRHELLEELPQPTRELHLWFPGANPLGGRDGLLVRFHPATGQPWIGTFAFGDDQSPGAMTGVYAAPNPNQLLIVSKGAGYFAHASDPASCERIDMWPIRDVRSLARGSLIVLADWIGLCAYGPTGLRWRTRRLVWDDLKVTAVTDQEIRGEGWNPSRHQVSTFVVNTETGDSSSDASIPE